MAWATASPTIFTGRVRQIFVTRFSAPHLQPCVVAKCRDFGCISDRSGASPLCAECSLGSERRAVITLDTPQTAVPQHGDSRHRLSAASSAARFARARSSHQLRAGSVA
jgi:hypothetical protein